MSDAVPLATSAPRLFERGFMRVDVESDLDTSLAAPEVLVVDDSETARERLRFILEGAGYVVTTACNGFEALACLSRQFIPLLITDVAMPEMGGLDLCRRLRRSALPSYLYAILLSLRDSPEEILDGLSAGADEYISKRANKSEVLARLLVGRRLVGMDQALRRALVRNQTLADTDDLTGSANRRSLIRGLEQELTDTGHQQQWLSVLMCHLDHLKAVNERFGHAVGDEVLQAFIARMRGMIGEDSGWIGRYVGEDFVVVLPAMPLYDARIEADRIRHAVAAQPLVCSVGALALTASIGVIGVRPADRRRGISVAELLDLADRCLSQSKAKGRDMVTARAFQASAHPEREPARTSRDPESRNTATGRVQT